MNQKSSLGLGRIGLVAAACLTLAACGGGGGGSASQPTDHAHMSMSPTVAPTVAASPSASQAPASAAAVVEEVNASNKGGDFRPAGLTIKAGETVEWVNHSGNIHNVTFDDKSLGNSSTMSANETFSKKFDKPGSYHYVCTFHPGMEGTVTVS
ncbi:MAG: cupredoxin domain-containing protein [Candidatus Dormibacteraeota bacterium]|uniref:Cupredoxin domain-containing protein n=1 Tax=Candidatus Dormiibacter inghamiae TaxID=3127013 RepID=A0A934K989_9BACT|nr:cupredoxin domain-containing protein [Candidatus Dormibacteraeota bacterium]MBJ7606654.1 cupredoxin domain-containing protein [Candidatus Dormibacteraeota bacterium]